MWEIFVATGDVSAKQPPARNSQRVLDENHKLLVVGLLLEQPDVYVREICQHIGTIELLGLL